MGGRALAAAIAGACSFPIATAAAPHLIPRPAHVALEGCRVPAATLLSAPSGFDPAAREEIDERWKALGIGTLRVARHAASAIQTRRDASLGAQAYRLTVDARGAVIESSDAAGAFYAAMTLAQLPARGAGGWSVPCVRIVDRPALRWRILSDDVSRGPLPTMRYFEERIRTLAAFKFNGYSPYMEHVFVSPTDPLPAPLDGITPQQLRELDRYAARFHVALIPEQQTFAHLHGVLRVEQYAEAAELPHGYLVSPGAAPGEGYLQRVISQELQAVPHPPFFHVGSDETATLGAGRSRETVAQRGRAQTFADHIAAMQRLIAASGARLMFWDDAIEQDPTIMPLLPRSAVIVNYHYGAADPFARDIALVAGGGFDQMVAPAAQNWDQLFPDVATAIENARGFVSAGKSAGVLGLFETVWHDDGESLYEATWYPVLYAGADAWQNGQSDPRAFAADFPSAFFGRDDARYADDVQRLADDLRMLDAAPYDRTTALFWADAFDAGAGARMAKVDLRQVRLNAESVERHLYFERPPLHGAAASAMDLAARRYDFLARKFQIAAEVRAMYADAQAHVNDAGGPALRDLYWCRYWMWELRDGFETLAPLYARAWRYESREGHLAGNLERYHLAAQRAIDDADAFYRATYDGYVRSKTLPPLSGVLRR
jgi:hexosaminidase